MVETASVTASTAAANQTEQSERSSDQSSGSVLGKDDFMKLLIAQLQNQDPTSPMDSAQFMAQMADFTNLEQIQNMSAAIEQMVADQKAGAIANEASMIGKEVQWTIKGEDDGAGDETSETKQGTIRSISIKDGEITYLTEDGDRVDPESITKITALD